MSLPREGSRDTGEGILVSIYPDVCLTPVGSSMVLVPYTLWAKQEDDANTEPTVRMTSLRTHNMGSLITTCHGDEAGTGGGVKSGTHNGICEPMEHSANVRIKGKNAIRHNDIWWMNNKNTQGKLLWIKDSDRQDLTEESRQGWKSLVDGSSALGLPKGVQMADASGAVPVPSGSPSLALATSVAFVAVTTTAAAPEVVAGGVGAAEVAGGGTLAVIEGGEALAGPWGWLALGLTVAGAGAYYYFTRPKTKAIDAPPVARTNENVNVSTKKKDDEKKDCITGKYKDIDGLCGAGGQAHHIVPDYTLRYGTRAEGLAGQKRIPGLPSFGDGPAICLSGYSKDPGDEHGIAHLEDAAVAALGESGSPKGTAPISKITAISVAGAIRAKPKCTKEIVAAVAQQPSLLSGIPGRTTIMPPGKWPP